MMTNRRVALLLLGLVAAGTSTADAAEIRWTRFGIPHIRATDHRDLGRGTGFAVARDRFCVLADRLLTLRGERSRWLGADGRTTAGFTPVTNIDSDLFHRVQLSDAIVGRAMQAMSADARALAAGYAEGVNRYVATLSATDRQARCPGTPIQPMKDSDVARAAMAIGALWKAGDVAAFATASDWNALPPKAQAAAVPRTTPIPIGLGSNVWSYGGDVTTTGSAIVMANPHTSWNAGDWLLMHELHLTIPGEIDVAGADFVGIPLPVTGFTKDVAWSIEAPITVRYHVLQKMALSDEKSPRYRRGDSWLPLRFEKVAIAVRAADGTVADRSFLLPTTELGPLYRLPASGRREAGWYAVADANEGNAQAIDQLLGMAKATSTAQWTAAIVADRGMTAHYVGGDRHGDTAYVEAGPLLGIADTALAACAAAPQDWTPILDGSKPECGLRHADGTPVLALADKLPALSTRGVVHNTNNSYHQSLFGHDVTGYSHLLGAPEEHDMRVAMSTRRIGELLARGKIGPQDALDLVLDDRNLAAETWLDPILRACKGASGAADGACRILAAWDRRNDGESRGTLLFVQLWRRLSEDQRFAAANPTADLPAALAADLPAMLVAIVAEMDRDQVPLDRPWKEVIGRPTAKGWVGLHGGDGEQGVLNTLSCTDIQQGRCADIASGTSYLQRVNWQDGRMQADALLAQGQSPDPASPHHADQLDPFARRQLQPFPFSEEEIERETIERATIGR